MISRMERKLASLKINFQSCTVVPNATWFQSKKVVNIDAGKKNSNIYKDAFPHSSNKLNMATFQDILPK